MLKDKHISKFSLITIVIILLLFFVYWSYNFGIFTPRWGTSTASISALWGQFFVSLFATLAVCAILLIADVRNKPTKIYQLASLYFLVIVAIFISWIAWKDKANYGTTHSYASGKEFSYLQYKLTVTAETQPLAAKDCSGLSNTAPKSGLIGSPSPMQECEFYNSSSSGKKVVTLHVVAKNTKSIPSHFTSNWFTVTDSDGRSLPTTFPDSWDSAAYAGDGPTINPEAPTNQIAPNGQIDVTLLVVNNNDSDPSSGSSHIYLLDRSVSINSVTIKIDNHAKQIVNL